MTRKDFELIARVFNDQLHNAHWDEILKTEISVLSLQIVVDALSTTNASFDRERFLTACGVDEVTK